MAIRETYICDICHAEQDRHAKVHWSLGFGGPCVVDVKNVPGIQAKFEWDKLCRGCGDAIREAVAAVLEARKPAPAKEKP